LREQLSPAEEVTVPQEDFERPEEQRYLMESVDVKER